jgi:hypothetical protein
LVVLREALLECINIFHPLDLDNYMADKYKFYPARLLMGNIPFLGPAPGGPSASAGRARCAPWL